MGATGWQYFVPYQSDVNQALQELRKEIFARKDYPAEITQEEGLEAIEQLAAMSPDPGKARAQMHGLLELARKFEALEAVHRQKRSRPKGEPRTIEELLKQRAENGTGTILDITHISELPESSAIHPLSAPLLQAFFGTEQPTRESVEQWQQRIPPIGELPLYNRWEGIYFLVYKNGYPEAIYFEGCSGD